MMLTLGVLGELDLPVVDTVVVLTVVIASGGAVVVTVSVAFTIQK